MKDADLYKNEQFDLSISKQFLMYSGKIVDVSDIQKARCLRVKANYAICQSVILIGVILFLLGMLRAGFTPIELLQLETINFYNGWGIVGFFLLLFGFMMSIILKDKHKLDIQLKNGKIVTFFLNKGDKASLNDINKALHQAIQSTNSPQTEV